METTENKVVIPPDPVILQAQQIMIELTEQFGQEPWWMGIELALDDAGTRINILTDLEIPVNRNIPTKYKDYFLIVTRKYRGKDSKLAHN